MLHSPSDTARPRFVSVEIMPNLFGEYSVVRESGIVGCMGQQTAALCEDLLTASRRADQVRERCLKRGYVRLN
ncbi:WGR domain-containing protein [Oceanomicrobium pacificus]|uniref:WGR domain-containing protein n=1 Tax=Oceanomicrobium pacificus TaxID=2692916 RepID=A0A6B0TSB2_9RHOB|nr:WGR domain-containing protein [Oceanomicrobium pacificus]MXU64695.1 hypothetical protein [Oceanomicrobium pacificus]